MVPQQVLLGNEVESMQQQNKANPFCDAWLLWLYLYARVCTEIKQLLQDTRGEELRVLGHDSSHSCRCQLPQRSVPVAQLTPDQVLHQDLPVFWVLRDLRSHTQECLYKQKLLFSIVTFLCQTHRALSLYARI